MAHPHSSFSSRRAGPERSGRVIGPAPEHGAAHRNPLLRVNRSTLLGYLGAAAVLSVAVAVAAPILPPVALGSILFAFLILAAWWTFVRRPSASASSHQVRELAHELLASRRQYERLFSAVPDFICVLDPQHNIVQANDLYRREFGATERSLCYEVCKQRATKCPDCVVDATFADGLARTQEETLITRNGRRITALVHTQPIFDENLNIEAVMEVFTDVTEITRLQRQLALTGRAVAGTAHRVKNILMGLEGGIFIVNDGLENDNREAITEGWEMVERNVHRVTAIVKDLLFCAKERTPEFETGVRPREIVEAVYELYADRMTGENIEIHAEVADDCQPGTFDPEAIDNLLCNLVGNAIDACRFDPSEDKAGHRVVIRCRQNEAGDTIFEVEDDGEGIPEDVTHKVFQEFFSSKGVEGTGIGLLVVQKVAEEHGGTVTFRSKPGEGTVFTVTIPPHRPLPIAQSVAAESGEHAPPPADPPPPS
ncbi:MAG: ATP-binding protein [Holophagae bacterium]